MFQMIEILHQYALWTGYMAFNHVASQMISFTDLTVPLPVWSLRLNSGISVSVTHLCISPNGFPARWS